MRFTHVVSKSRRSERGFTLLESFIAMSVLTFGLVGLVKMIIVTSESTGVGRHRTLASTLARDLVSQVDAWAFDDARLSNSLTSNDGACTHTGGGGSTVCTVGTTMISLPNQRTLSAGTHVDHVEADLTAGGLVYQGLALPKGYERYLNVWPIDMNSNGTADSLMVVVVVRYWRGSTPEDVVLTTTKVNTVEIVRGGVL